MILKRLEIFLAYLLGLVKPLQSVPQERAALTGKPQKGNWAWLVSHMRLIFQCPQHRGCLLHDELESLA